MLKKIKVIDAFSVFLLIALIGVVVYGLVLQIDSISGISPSTKTRVKITSEATPGEALFDISPDWTENTDYIEAVLPAFQEATGVIPYLKVLSREEISDPALLQKETDSLYENLFDDEDHFLFVFAPQQDRAYLYAYCVGSQAASVMDEEAIQIILEYLQKYTHNTECGPEDLFLRTYRSTYERIMGTQSNGILYTVFLCAIVAALLVFLGFRTVRILSKARS